MGNIFKYEFKMYSKSILIWSLSFAMIIFLMMVFYPTFGSDVALVDKMLENYPEELLKAFGMSSSLSLATVLGYFSFVFAMVQLFIAIQAANYGFSILSVEEREFTADYLMSKPVSRKQILIAKFGASFLTLIITNLVIWLSTFIAIEMFKDGKTYDADKIVLLLSTIVVFQLFFLCLGMFISVCVKRVRSVLSFSLGLAFGTYILNTVRAIVGGEVLGYASPFYHFDPIRILETGKLNVPMVVISCVSILISVVGTVLLYSKRDISSL